jgi:hypothetical protein
VGQLGSIFWFGIVIGGLVGFVASIAANLTTPGFGAYFLRGKAELIERNKRRAMKQYVLLKRFQNGSEDKYMYFVAQWGYILLYTILGAGLAIVSKVVPLNAVELIISDIGVVGSFVIVFTKLFRLTIWYRRINNFQKYEEALTKKWGEVEVPSQRD